MRFVLYPLLLLSLCIFIGAAYALPNLKVSWVQYSPATERVVAEISNDSAENASGFSVEFLADGKTIGSVGTEEPLMLEAHSVMHVYTSYPNDGKSHEFSAIVDPVGTVRETGKIDNETTSNYSGDTTSAAPQTASDGAIASQNILQLVAAIVVIVVVIGAAGLLLRRARKRA